VRSEEGARRVAVIEGRERPTTAHAREPPAWAMEPIPEVTVVCPRIGDVETRKAARLKEPHVQDLTS